MRDPAIKKLNDCLLQLDNIMLQQRFPLRKRIFKLLDKAKQAGTDALALNAEVEALALTLSDAQTRVQQRQQAVPRIEYPDLPVSERRDDIKAAIAQHQVVIIAGETGSGKTTQIPKICLELGRGIKGLIGHTQPRRLAARSVAQRIADELQSPLGQQVGFKIRFSDQSSDNTYVKLMTDGILLAEIQQDRFLNQYDTLIIDEAHERSLNIDFLLGYLTQLLPKRPDLKLIITSATIDPERFSKHFNQAPIITVSGRTFPVEIRYRDPTESEQELDQTDAIIAAVEELMSEPPGDILVFLSGEREIRDTQDALQRRQFRHTEIVPLYARLSAAEQNRIFQAHSGRRIVLATNVAETSLTVPGIKYVIDPGTARLSRYSARSKVQRLPIEPISQASANQRAGRCGRVSNGICIRLYSEQDYLGRPAFTDPEILRTNLASVILQMLALGLGDIARFPFVQPPDSRNISDGFRLLEELQAVARHQGKSVMTPLGRQMARLPLDPRYARMIIEAGKTGALNEVVIIAAGLSIQDPRERPHQFRQQADEKHREFADKDSDFVSLLNLWRAFRHEQQQQSQSQLRRWCKTFFINYLRMREWQDIVSQVRQSLAELNLGVSQHEASYDAIHIALCAGLLSHVGMKEKERDFVGARNSKFQLFPGSGLSKQPPKWVIAAELTETTRLYGRTNARIEPTWLEPLSQHLCKSSYSEPHWSKKRGAVLAYEKVSLFGLPIVNQRPVTYSLIDPALCHRLFIQEALVNGDTQLNFAFLKDNLALMEEAETLEEKTRRRDILADEETLVAFYAERIPEHVNNEAAFKKWWRQQNNPQLLNFTTDDVFRQTPSSRVAEQFPDSWQQGNLRLPLRYHFEPSAEDDGVTVQIPLPVLNQVSPLGFDWQVPGLRHELVVQLIKSLPKRLRRNFVPAPDFAEACLADIQAQDKDGRPISLCSALSEKLRRMTGVLVEESDWQKEGLSKHLVVHFEVLDGKGQRIAQGDDLEALKRRCQGKVQQTFEQAATPELERKGLTSWDFEQLPATFTQRVGGFSLKAYPALVAKGDRVDIELLDSEEKAALETQQGVYWLIKQAIPSPLSYLQNKLPNKAKLGLYFNPFGQIAALIDDCIMAGIASLVSECLDEEGTVVRDKTTFSRCCDYVRGRINDRVLHIAETIEQGLTLAHACQKQMKGKVALNMVSALGDIKQHLNTLVYPGFVSDIGTSRLNDWNRYLKALHRRLEKLPVDPHRDKLQQLQITAVKAGYEKLTGLYPHGRLPVEVVEVRWMIEELAVSLFAQQLGTAYPISAKRIELRIDELKKQRKG